MPEPQLFDVIALVLVGWLTIRGAMRGMITQLTSVAAVLVSWVVAAKFSPKLAPLISDEEPFNKIVAMLLLFVATSVVIWLLHGLLAGIFEKIKLKGFDRQMGALLGLAKGLLLCMILTFFLVTLSEKTKSFALDSLSGTYFATGIEKIGSIFPDDANVILKKNLEGFRESLRRQSLQEDGQEREFHTDSISGFSSHDSENGDSSSEKSLADSLKEGIGKIIGERIGNSFSKSGSSIVSEENQLQEANVSYSDSANPVENVASAASSRTPVYPNPGRSEFYAPPVPLNGGNSSDSAVVPFKSSSTGYPPVIPKR